MAKVENVHVYGLEDVFKKAKYPFAISTGFINNDLTKGIETCMTCETGQGHDNALNGIIVQFDLTFSNKAWVEMQRYHFMDFVSSMSTMHMIKSFDIDAMCNDYVDCRIISLVKELQQEYRDNPSAENKLKLLYNIPSGFELTAAMTTNYRQLKTIYQQRRNHELPDWQVFCDWIETLPYSYLITGKEKKNRALMDSFIKIDEYVGDWSHYEIVKTLINTDKIVYISGDEFNSIPCTKIGVGENGDLYFVYAAISFDEFCERYSIDALYPSINVYNGVKKK